jgi:hypothetical protein
MKARPRSIEREVAKRLSAFFATVGLPPVERIPVLGRTGPDLSWNDAKLIVDVKSRIEVPKTIFWDEPAVLTKDGLLSVRLDALPALTPAVKPMPIGKYISVAEWYAHMDEWTRQNVPDGISALVLHRPAMKLDRSVFIVKNSDLERMFSRWKQPQL